MSDFPHQQNEDINPDQRRQQFSPQAYGEQRRGHNIEERKINNEDSESILQHCYDDVRSHINDLSMQLDSEHDISQRYDNLRSPGQKSPNRLGSPNNMNWQSTAGFDPNKYGNQPSNQYPNQQHMQQNLRGPSQYKAPNDRYQQPFAQPGNYPNQHQEDRISKFYKILIYFRTTQF